MSKTTVDELKTLYVKLGGNIADVANIQTDAEIIDKIEDLDLTAGRLPEVTSTDNGDILSVVEGAWAKADPPSELPTVTSSDNGDVLTVVKGAWAKAEPPTDLPAVTSSDNSKVLGVVGGAWTKMDQVKLKPIVGGTDANGQYKGQDIQGIIPLLYWCSGTYTALFNINAQGIVTMTIIDPTTMTPVANQPFNDKLYFLPMP